MFLGKTNQDGLLSAEVNLDDVGEMSVVVTKPNFLPYEGNITVSITADVDEDDEENNISSFDLFQNYPNPFNPVTKIQFRVQSLKSREPLHTILNVYNILGQKVRTLVDEPKSPGSYEVIWDGKDGKGNDVSSGIYFYRLDTENYQKTRKMTLLK